MSLLSRAHAAQAELARSTQRIALANASLSSSIPVLLMMSQQLQDLQERATSDLDESLVCV